MAVASRGKALSLFQKLIYDEPLAAENILADPYLPAGLAPSQDRVGIGPRDADRRVRAGGALHAATPQMLRRYAILLALRPPYCQAAHRSTGPMWRRTPKTASTSPWKAAPPPVSSTHSQFVSRPQISAFVMSGARPRVRSPRRSPQQPSLVVAARCSPLLTMRPGTSGSRATHK